MRKKHSPTTESTPLRDGGTGGDSTQYWFEYVCKSIKQGWHPPSSCCVMLTGEMDKWGVTFKCRWEHGRNSPRQTWDGSYSLTNQKHPKTQALLSSDWRPKRVLHQKIYSQIRLDKLRFDDTLVTECARSKYKSDIHTWMWTHTLWPDPCLELTLLK